MKISAFESGQASAAAPAPEERVLPKGAIRDASAPSGRPKSSREQAIEVAKEALKDVPDVREDQVEEIRAKIESGEYKLDSDAIAEMMVRRMKADRIR